MRHAGLAVSLGYLRNLGSTDTEGGGYAEVDLVSKHGSIPKFRSPETPRIAKCRGMPSCLRSVCASLSQPQDASGNPRHEGRGVSRWISV